MPASAATVVNATLQTQIAGLNELAETQHEQAINQLQALLQQLPANASFNDRRELLLALIPLYFDAGDKDQARTLNAYLSSLGQQFHDQFATAMAMTYQANLLEDEGKLGDALEIIEQALVIAKQAGDNRLDFQAHSVAGDLYAKVGNFQTALQHQLTAMEVSDDGDRQSELRRAKTLNNIGRLYLSLKDPKTALEYNAKANDLATKIDSRALMANIANNRGYAYADQEQWEQAISAYTEGLKIARSGFDRRDEAVALNNLADAALNQGRFPACVQFAQQAIDIAQKDARNDLISVGFVNLGVCHMDMGALAQGAAETKRGIDFSRKAKATPTIEMALGDLAEAYAKAGLYQDAFKAMQEQRKLATELFHAERDRAVTELQARFEVSQRQKQIEALEQKNLLQSVEIENKSLQRVIAILATAVAAAVTISILLLYRKVRQSNRLLQDTNLQLEHQSIRDPLTGLLNRRAFQNLMRTESQGKQHIVADKTKLPSALVLLDIDYFKRINDNYGHAVGDLVLVEIGKRLQSLLREKDMLMRWGGEEFLIYLHAIPIERLSQVIERALSIVGGTPVNYEDKSVAVTISAGYILVPLPGIEDVQLGWEKAIQLSDIALYMAKSGGRNHAIGIERALGTKEQIRNLAEGDLQGAVDQGVVTLQRIAGPAVEQV
jgi:diguanylate cyclase (GGDEF)-like protein